MKLLVLSLLFCAAMAQTKDTTAPDSVTESKPGEGAGQALDYRVKRSSGIWQTYNGRSFIFMASSQTWGQAQQHCLALGGNLATIHNRDEDDFVKGVVAGGRAWIGLSDAQTDGYWFWINGKPLAYTNWCPGEPNNLGEKQHCAVINFSAKKCWDDEYCSITRPFVCEKVAPDS